MKKKIIVTGATSGMGLALISLLKNAGFTPILTARNGDKVKTLARQLGVIGYQLDVSDPEQIETVTKQIIADNGPIWGLVNNAGIWLEGPFEDHAARDIQNVINTNTLGTMLMTHAVLPHMLGQNSGAIVNVVSTGALYTRKSIAVYSASKWAIRGFTGCLEAEYAPKGIRVMGFYPGKIATDMYKTAGIERNLDVAMTPDQAARMVVTILQDEDMVWSHVSGRSLADYA